MPRLCCGYDGCYSIHRVFVYNPEPVYRRCEKEFKSFVEAFTTMLTEVDPQIPPLPPKDLVHRIYRDVRDNYIDARRLTGPRLDPLQQR